MVKKETRAYVVPKTKEIELKVQPMMLPASNEVPDMEDGGDVIKF